MAAFFGFFTPSDQQLITDYLRRKVLRMELSTTLIVEKNNIYGDHVDSNPWNVFNDQDPWETRNTIHRGKTPKNLIYAFTRLRRRRDNTNGINRRAGFGFWQPQDAPKEIVNADGEAIGKRTLLRFELSSEMDEFDMGGRWFMHEYSLHGVRNDNDYVLCVVVKDKLAPPILN